MTSFLEAGIVFGRDLQFADKDENLGAGFDVSDGFIIRLGLRF